MPVSRYNAPSWLLALALLVPAQVHAIVIIEGAWIKKSSDGFSGALDLDTKLSSGNTDNKRLGIGSRLQWDAGNKTDLMLVNYSYGESNGVRDENKGFLHLRHVVHRNSKLAWEGFGQVEQNEFTRLEYRGLIGLGLRRTLSQDGDKSGMYLGLGGFYSTENLADSTSVNLVRANLYFVVKKQMGDTARFVSTTYLQPALDNPEDFRALEQLGYAIALNKKLDLKFSLNIAHDSQPPSGVEATDIGLQTGISYRF